jgi:hypothetical protein
VRRLCTSITAAAVIVAVTAAGCAQKPNDYQSIYSKSATTTTTTAPSGKPQPMSKYLETLGITGEPVDPNTLPDLTVSIPTPPGWEPYTTPKLPTTTKMISKGGKDSTAMLVVFKLHGPEFDVADAIKHANADAQALPNFRQLDASDAPFNGFPSSMIQASYGPEGMRLHSYNRMVIATGSAPVKQRYVVQLTITSLATRAVDQSAEIESIIRGLVIAAK